MLGITFRNPLLLEAALRHPSYRNENPMPGLEDFDRLEFFGDVILNFIVCQKLFNDFPKANDGALSRLRSILVSRKILSRIAQEIGLTRHIKLSKSLRKQKEISKAKIFADTFEAFFAAIYLDQGMHKAEPFILKHFHSYFDAKRLFRLDPNPKSTLQELSQKTWQKLPIYQNEFSPRGVKTTIAIDRRRKTTAVAKTRRKSEEKAARLLIRKIRQEFVSRSKKKSSGKKLRRTF
ncbi:MAG: ribonuclease III [Candidatus Omnitrophica bacterium]|nr:ribonuclease III [Candidatus Omnitrophota bacterium]